MRHQNSVWRTACSSRLCHPLHSSAEKGSAALSLSGPGPQLCGACGSPCPGGGAWAGRRRGPHSLPGARAHLPRAADRAAGQLALPPPEATGLLLGSVYRLPRLAGLFAASGTLHEEANRVRHSLQPENSATLSVSEERQTRQAKPLHGLCTRLRCPCA